MSDSALSQAIVACDRALATLDDACVRIERARLDAIEDWVGPHRRHYDEASTRWRGAADDVRFLIADVRHGVAARLESAIADRRAERQALHGPY